VSNHKRNDPYVYPDSQVLINKYDIRDAEALQEVEGFLFALKSTEPLPAGHFDYEHLKAIHFHYFNEIYTWAAQERSVDIAKQNSYFAHIQYIAKELTKTFSQLKKENYLQDLTSNDFCSRLAHYFNDINAAHPFREGNGRTLRAFCDLLAEQAGYQLDWARVSIDEYTQANIHGFNGDYDAMKDIFLGIVSPIVLTKDIPITPNQFTKAVQKNIMIYIEKQQELLYTIQQKNQHAINNPEISKSLNTKTQTLDRELRKLAVTLMQHNEIKKFIKDNAKIYSSIAKLGGFDIIHTRIKNNVASINDWLAVLRHAQNKILTLSNTINRHGQSR
jgi:cell filamentation protein